MLLKNIEFYKMTNPEDTPLPDPVEPRKLSLDLGSQPTELVAINPRRKFGLRASVVNNTVRRSEEKWSNFGLEQPDPAILKQLLSESPKIRYVDMHALNGELKAGEPEYYKAIHDILLKILAEFPEVDMLGVRAVSASINGDVTAGEQVEDVVSITEDGIDRGKEYFNVDGVNKANLNEHEATLFKYAINYLMANTFLRMEIDDEQQAKAVFPVLLIYDASYLMSTEHERFSATFKDASQAQQALLRVVIFDAPTT